MKMIYGDLIKLAQDKEFDIIVHGCNCFNTMGAGFALQIKKEFPEVYNVDLMTKRGDWGKLGKISVCTLPNIKLIVINAYTQYYYGGGINADYDAIRSCFKLIKEKYGQWRIGYPMIGSGRAGGDWSKIKLIIDEELDGCDHTCVVYKK